MSPEAVALLEWYDRMRRDLPWRAKPGETVDPYRVWLSEIMLQQTTVAAVKPYFETFTAIWPTVEALAAAPDEDVMRAWAGLGYYSRARNLLACARRVVADHGGRFPADENALRALPGIGDYTAAAIRSIAFGLPAVVVDGNVERVISRYGAIEAALPAARPAIKAATARLSPQERPGDFAQAMMDLGATICTPKKPACALCPWLEGCTARKTGRQEDFPVKAAKAARPIRRGAAYVAIFQGEVLIETRPAKGLLGGMAGFPGSEWLKHASLPMLPASAPFAADWRFMGAISHGFTHFELELAVFRADLNTMPEGRMVPLATLEKEALPTVMRKVATLAIAGGG